MASPAYRSHNRTSYATGITSVSPAKPTGLADGDLVLLGVLLFEDANALNAEKTISWPSGFTEIFSDYNGVQNGHEIQLAVAYKYISSAAGEPATYSPSWTGNADGFGFAAAYSGVHATGLVDDSGTGTGLGTTVTCPAVTADQVETLAVAVSVSWGVGSPTYNDGLTGRETANGSMALGDEAVASAGAVAANTISWANDRWIGGTVLLASTVAAPGGDAVPQAWAQYRRRHG
jgi:hypothetical protein